LIKIESKRLSLAPDVLATLGLDGVQRRWHAVLADLDAHALNADPREVYAKNPAFWRATAAVSVAISAIDDMPLSLDLAVSGGRPERRNARTVEIKESTFDKTWTAQHDQLVKARGADVREPPPGVVGAPMHVPRTTYADVRQLATYWQDALTAVDDPGRHGDALHRIATPAGLAEERTRWQAVMADIDQLVKANPSDVYAKNHEFWRASQSLATTLGRIHPRPVPPSKLTLDVPEEGLGDRLLDFVKDLPGQIADAAGAVADAVGTLGRDAGAGFFEGLGVPLLIGAGGLVALWLLLRRPDRREAE
jgi:hypothetical protein